MRRFLAFLFLSSLALAAARAQTVRWEGADDSSEIQLIFEECTPEGDPQLPAIDDSVLSLRGKSSQTMITNGSFSRATILTYHSRARRAGVTLQIPAFTVQTNKGPLKVAAFTGGAPRVIPDSTVGSRLMTGSTTLWAGEVFSLVYTLDAARRYSPQLAGNLEWNPEPLAVEDWSKPELAEMSLNGEPRINVTYKTRGYAKVPGPLVLNPVTQLVRIATGNINFGLFQQQRAEELTVSTRRPELTIRPLPTPNVTGFSGAVGDFKLVSKVVPNTAAVGDPITWTLELSGSGNWPDIAGLPQRDVSKDFQVVQPKAKRTPVEGKLFDATLTEDVVLVPTRPGTYTLGPVYFTYFDPKSGSYQTLSTPRTTITVTPPAPVNPGIKLPAIAGATPPAETPANAIAPTRAPEIPAVPAGIPRDPLPATGSVTAPRPVSELVVLLLAPCFLLLAFWLGLSLRRARSTDPVRHRRAARARLAASLARLQSASPAERPALLLAWQHDTAVLWEILHAAPGASALGDADWATLWAESDRALYGADPADLPADWVPRAGAALAAKRVPGFSPFSALLPRNLIPLLAFGLVTLSVTALHAEDGGAAYRRADFPAAEKAWRETVAQDPRDPSARYNLSLALAQQDRWDLAMAHATAAFVQAPNSEAVRWQFALAAEKSGYVPEPLAAFLHPGPPQTLARLASPGGWQCWLITAAVLVVLSLGVMLFGAYASRSSIPRTAGALLLFSSGLLLAMASVTGFRAFGETADTRAVIVWRGGVLRSIPTEADTTQKTTALPAGSIAIADDNTFVGWVRLTFANGQTGWVRKDDVVPLWK